MLILWDDKIRDATVDEASNETLGASYVQSDQPGARWRSTSLAPAYIVIDFGAATGVDTVFVGYTNATTGASAATWQVRLATTKAKLTTTPDHDSGSMNWNSLNDRSAWPWSSDIYRPGSTQTYRWMRVDISDASNADGFLDVGRIMAGVAMPLAQGSDWGWTTHVVDESARSRNPGGPTWVLPVRRFRRVSLSLGKLTDSELYAATGAQELDRVSGTARPVVWMAQTGTSYPEHELLYGRISDTSPVSRFVPGVNRKSWQIDEALP